MTIFFFVSTLFFHFYKFSKFEFLWHVATVPLFQSTNFWQPSIVWLETSKYAGFVIVAKKMVTHSTRVTKIQNLGFCNRVLRLKKKLSYEAEQWSSNVVQRSNCAAWLHQSVDCRNVRHWWLSPHETHYSNDFKTAIMLKDLLI